MKKYYFVTLITVTALSSLTMAMDTPGEESLPGQSEPQKNEIQQDLYSQACPDKSLVGTLEPCDHLNVDSKMQDLLEKVSFPQDLKERLQNANDLMKEMVLTIWYGREICS